MANEPDLVSDALEFVARVNQVDACTQDRRAFAVWRVQSSAHEEAAREAERLWRDLGETKHAYQHAAEVKGAQAAIFSRRRFLAAGAMAASVAGVVGYAGLWSGTAEYQTEVGERRFAEIGQGRSVWLNTNSAFSPATAGEPARLHQGEAFFALSETAGPFVLDTGECRLVAAEPCAFNVRREAVSSETFSLFVETGSVRLSVNGRLEAITLNVLPGERISIGTGTNSVPEKVLAEGRIETAWKRGRLIFEENAFGDVIAELDRYVSERLFVVGDALTRLNVTGVFNLDKPDALVDTIRRILPVRLMHLPGAIVFF